MSLQLTGIHHLTAITANAPENLRFYTGTLGLRLVKKTVNQDDTTAYHLFYADGQATPGTDLTFFDWPVGREGRGTHSISRTGLRVGSAETVRWWKSRFDELEVASGEVAEIDGRASSISRTARASASGSSTTADWRRPTHGKGARFRPSIRSRALGRSPSACRTSATPRSC